MTLDTLIMFTGALVAVLPFLGLPSSWDTVLFFLAGVFVIALGIIVRRRGLGLPEEERRVHMERRMEAERTPETDRELGIE